MKANNIEKGNYEGYVWKSDKDAPERIDGEYGNELDPKQNPFIIEAQLFDKERGVSYSVKYVDGQYVCRRFVVDSLDYNREEVEEVEIKKFQSNRIKGEKVGMRFLRYWRESEDVDNLCCGMKTLQPAELVFVGFINKQED